MPFGSRSGASRAGRVKPGGVVEIRAPELPEGARAEVIVVDERYAVRITELVGGGVPR
mgnify:CR=1 FL=1